MLSILVVAAICLFSYYFLYKPQTYWRNKNVKQGPAIPILGDNLKITFKQTSMVEHVKGVYDRFKDVRYSGIYQAGRPTLVLHDPELIKQITIKDFDHFLDHMSFTTEDIEPLWNKNLFALKGDKWREMRATLSPTFTASKMRAMFALMEKSAHQYVDFYLKQNENVVKLELKDSFTRFANDVIANCAFGITVDSLQEPKNIFYMNVKEITIFSGFWRGIKFLIMFLAPKIAQFFRFQMFPTETKDFFVKLVKDTVKVREEQNIFRPDMINLLMEARKGKLRHEETEKDQNDAGFATAQESHVGKAEPTKKMEMTDMDMAAQVMIFFFAGFDTISTMMSFMCYELAVNPDVQDRLRQEVDETYKNTKGQLTYDSLNKMKYMDMVTTESLRKHPPFVSIDRVCTKAYTIKPERPDESPVDLAPGDLIWLPIVGIHNDERYYPNPAKFDPERFSDENKHNIEPYTYLPFGVGPRNCIGSRFALMEVKTLVYHILAKFELTVIEKTVIPIKYDRYQFTSTIEGGCWVGFKRRKNASSF